MKNLKPTFTLLFIMCIFNFSKAQEKSGLDIQQQNQSEVSGMIESNQNADNKLQNSSDEEELSRGTLSVSYTYNGTWSPSSPIGVATSIDTITLESGTVSITADTVCDNFIVNAGAGVIIDAGVTLTTAVIDLNSTSQEFSSLISNGTIVGIVNYHRYTSQIGTNDLISSPLSNQNFGSFATANDGVLAASGAVRAFAPYNTFAGAYQNYNTVAHDVTPIEAGIGYRAATVLGGTLTFTGDVRSDDVLDVPISDAVAGGAWNLIGNPYTAYIDFEDFFMLNKAQLADDSFQAIYGYNGNPSDEWTCLNQATIDAPAGTKAIAPGQAFFVKAKAGGGLIDFTTSMRCVETSDDFIAGRTTTTSPHYGYVKLGLNSVSSNFSTDFYFNTNTTQGFDSGYDSALYSQNPPAFSIYSNLIENNTGIPLGIQASNPDNLNTVAVPLGVNANQGEEVTISIIASDMLDTVDVYLQDKANNTFTLLTNSDYVFTPSTNLSGIGRFFLRFSAETLNTTESVLETLDIYSNNNEDTIVVSGQLQSDTKAKLFDINGRMVLTNSLSANNTKNTIDVSHLSAGIYVVELNNGTNERQVQKLVIR
ncbi:T9SS type A sorting domain-containing protein [Psychroserpens luteus]|uniref:T9SS type A sorting domain-containing protein n=1 Tax=Psychroserpens luteus TaxID=1434066 RepID=A0ABW5ZQS3_9FLAO|nr:T9SS type A sorting domain-containing protein [Psychroserpens luteus]